MRALLAVLILLAPLGASASWKSYRKKPDEWFRSDEAKSIAQNVLAWQTERGDWPNDNDSFAPYDKDKATKPGTFDDGHTTHETRFLVRMYEVTGDAAYKDAALKAIDHVINAQYSSGGFPQRFPPGDKYPRHITFNDRTMVNLLELLWDVATDESFEFVGEDRRFVARKCVNAGVRCILACQVRNEFGLTAWGAQHDVDDFHPRPARTFEPASLAAAESADILLFLMSFEDPSLEVLNAVDAGVDWFRKAALHGIRVERTDDDVIVVRDRSAPPTWARFYDLKTMRPVFAGRDGIPKSSLAAIEKERRAGYAWFGNWGEKVLKAYEQWPHRNQYRKN